jgi:hypothetical protein
MGKGGDEAIMPAKKQKKTQPLMELTFKQIATAPRGKEIELYGLTENGKVFLLAKNRGYWTPCPMGTPIEGEMRKAIKVKVQRFGKPLSTEL